jgi:single-stranded-DNA-specific exonuclease
MGNIKTWDLLSKEIPSDKNEIVEILLKNRGIKTKKDKEEFFQPSNPMETRLSDISVDPKEVKKAILRIKKAMEGGEHVIVYGDYDADGITGTAIMWETLHNLGIHVLPHIPERFTEGYGLNVESVKKLKEKDPDLSLIITVDHGITATDKVGVLKKLGIDMIISDHHQAAKKIPNPLALVYTTEVGGSALSWFLAREITKTLSGEKNFKIEKRLELAAIGTIADQLPLVGVNRSIVKYGLEELNRTSRPGLIELFAEAKIEKGSIGAYEVGFIIAPRINSTGRLKHGLESLRLLCTTSQLKALEIASGIAKTNIERQKIVEEVVIHAKNSSEKMVSASVIVLSHDSYHEGVIGLAAARLVEEYYRPSIVISTKDGVGKASARSISGFNIIEAIRAHESLYIEGGGHTMAAGFSIKTENIPLFTQKIQEYAAKLLTDDVLKRKLKADLEIDPGLITFALLMELKKFDPTGIGNASPTFITKNFSVSDFKKVGKRMNHFKLKLEKDKKKLDAIFFDGATNFENLKKGDIVDVIYRIEENVWNGISSIQLLVKDIRVV